MGACEPGQARDRAAISGNFHVPGFSLKAVFFLRLDVPFFPNIPIFPFFAQPFLGVAALFHYFYRSPIFPTRSFRRFSRFAHFTVFPLNFFVFSKNFAEFAKKLGKIAPRRLF